ncbi:hypothetical protein [Flavobacterium sp.]|uniref:hypothetical protein n=1 Tax=Flavobacterium sp. TaxID=239 RepID=UPI003BD512E3
MKINEYFEYLKKNISDCEMNVDAVLLSEDGEELTFNMYLYSIEYGSIRISFQFVINKLIMVDLINSNTNGVKPQTENSDFINFVKNKKISLLTHLKEYNKNETNYEKLAEMYIDSKGFVIGKRFGF